MFGRFFVCPLIDSEPGLKVVRLGDGDDDVVCHFYAGWVYYTTVASGGQSFRWAFRGCSAYGRRAVRIVRRAYRNRWFEVDMEITPRDFTSARTGDVVQWHRVLAIDGPFARVSRVKEFYTDAEINAYWESKGVSRGKTGKGVSYPATDSPGNGDPTDDGAGGID